MNSDCLKARLTAAALRDEKPSYKDLHVAESLLLLAKELGLDLVELVETIPEGADTQRIVDRWLHWLLSDCLDTYDGCEQVALLYQRRLEGDEPPARQWKAAVEKAADILSTDEPDFWAPRAASWAAQAHWSGSCVAAVVRSAEMVFLQRTNTRTDFCAALQKFVADVEKPE